MAKISVKIRAQAKRNEIMSLDPLVIRVAAPAIEGKANEELIKFLSTELDIPQARIKIVHGAHIKQKILEIEDFSVDEIIAKLARARGQLLL